MKKIILLFSFAVALVCSCGRDSSAEYPKVFAHRGCWLADYIPENSLDAVEMAARYSYPTTECDVKLTADSVHVLMHDGTINRTMRRAADYSVIEEKLRVKDLSFERLRNEFVLASEDSARRVPIPTFEEYMHKCVECGIRPILHCDLFSGYQIAQEIAPDGWIAFTTRYDVLLKVREMSPEVLILYAVDELSREEKDDPRNIIAKLEAIGRPCGISSMNMKDVTPAMCEALKAEGYEIQSSIAPSPKDMTAIHNGCTIVLTDFEWFQTNGRKPVATFSRRGMTMSEGEVVETSWDKMQHGAVVVNLSCTGEFELVVNGRLYPVSHATCDKEIVGIRMYDEAASVSLKSIGAGGSVEALKVEVYNL